MIRQALRQLTWRDIRIKKAWGFSRLVWKHYFGSYIQEWRLARHNLNLSDQELLSALGLSGDINTIVRKLITNRPGNFFIDPNQRQTVTAFCQQYYQSEIKTTLAAADSFCAHVFDLLASGPISLGPVIPWRTDFKTQFTWAKKYYRRIKFLDQEKSVPYDVKVPWELSRFYHATTLGQAYWFTGDEKYPAEFVSQVTSWFQDNPYLFSVNWIVAMEAAIRCVNLTWGLYFMKDSTRLTDALLVSVYKSMLQHGRFIMENLEFNKVASNHYLSNGVGLIFLGLLYPEFSEAKAWLAKGLEILTSEMPKQIYSDGVDHELSIPYHRLVTEFYLTSFLLCQSNNINIDPAHWRRLEKMINFIDGYTKPDGLAPVIGDADDGRLQILSEATRIAKNDHRYLIAIGNVIFPSQNNKREDKILPFESFWILGIKGWQAYQNLKLLTSKSSLSFPAGGFYIIRHDKLFSLIDAGGVGLRGHGGHGHNDVLSFVLNWQGYDYFIDPGSYVYTAAPQDRNLFRSAAFHNTAQVDQREINDIPYDDLFSLPEQANPHVRQWQIDDSRIIFEAEHFGYQKLIHPVTHRRRITYNKSDAQYIIEDFFIGTGEHKIQLYFHLAPGCRIIKVSQSEWQISRPVISTNLEMSFVCPVPFQIESWSSFVSPSYGVKTPAPVIGFTTMGLIPINIITKVTLPTL